MRLCLIVSRRCDLRCGFCQVEFTGEDMGWEVARAAALRYLGWLPAGTPARVKFFGGEPLINFEAIRRLVDWARESRPLAGIRFDLPTNGTLLDAPKLAWLSARPEVEVTLSHPAPGAAALPGVWYTVVLAQGTQPKAALARMRSLLKDGYRRFNFLPAYYAPWTDAEVRGLEAAFAALARLFERLWEEGVPIRLKNAEVWSPVPLYNDAVTVAPDGAIYASNMIQCKGMEKYRDRLRLGDIRDPKTTREALAVREGLLEEILRDWTGPAAWESTRRVDGALTEFVEALSRSREAAAAGG